MIEKETIFWDDSEPLSDWIENMMIPGTHGDSYALQGWKLFSCGQCHKLVLSSEAVNIFFVSPIAQFLNVSI